MMTEKTPRDSERAPLGRLVLWGLLALALIIGLVLYFVYQRRTPSLLWVSRATDARSHQIHDAASATALAASSVNPWPLAT